MKSSHRFTLLTGIIGAILLGGFSFLVPETPIEEAVVSCSISALLISLLINPLLKKKDE